VRIQPTSAFVAIVSILAFTSQDTQALMADPNLVAPSLMQEVACRLVREQVFRPFGPPVYRERETCGEPLAMVVDDETCIVRRERIEHPDGTMVVRRVRRCR
jgi:hypothetical protein